MESPANGDGGGEVAPAATAPSNSVDGKQVPTVKIFEVSDRDGQSSNHGKVGDSLKDPLAAAMEASETDEETSASEAGYEDQENDRAAYSQQGEVVDGGEESEEWEDQSLYEEMLAQDMQEEASTMDAIEFCTSEESKYYKELLRKVGSKNFVDQTVANGSIPAKKLITAFGIRPPAFLEGTSDTSYFTLLGLAMQREMARRLKLPHVNTMEDVVRLIKKSSNIMVLTGAGISTSLGIPDFRSQGSGLYSRLEGLGLSDPQQVFDIELFKEDPSIFYSVAKEILPSTKRFSPTHAFIELLQRKGKLLRNYTQNIDNLEQWAGVRTEKLIQCHGSFATASCIKCHYQTPGDKIFDDLRVGNVAKCERCKEQLAELASNGIKKRKRGKSQQRSRKNRYCEDSSEDEENWTVDTEPGIMKPDIIFFGEQLPDRFHRIVDHDRAKVDLLICIGTSLKVAPVSELTAFLPATVPQIYISREPVYHVDFDVELLGNLCDDIVFELCRQAGWQDDLKHEMIPMDLKVEGRFHDTKPSQHFFTRVSPSAPLTEQNFAPIPVHSSKFNTAPTSAPTSLPTPSSSMTAAPTSAPTNNDPVTT